MQGKYLDRWRQRADIPYLQLMMRISAALCVSTLLLSACTGSEEAVVFPTTTSEPATTTTEAAATTTTEAEATTTTVITALDPTEAGVRVVMEQYFSYEWDEQEPGDIGVLDRQRMELMTDPLLTRVSGSLDERIANSHFRRGIFRGPITSIEVTGESAMVRVCAEDAVGRYADDGTEITPPDDFSLISQWELSYDSERGWLVAEFLLGSECEQ